MMWINKVFLFGLNLRCGCGPSLAGGKSRGVTLYVISRFPLGWGVTLAQHLVEMFNPLFIPRTSSSIVLSERLASLGNAQAVL